MMYHNYRYVIVTLLYLSGSLMQQLIQVASEECEGKSNCMVLNTSFIEPVQNIGNTFEALEGKDIVLDCLTAKRDTKLALFVCIYNSSGLANPMNCSYGTRTSCLSSCHVTASLKNVSRSNEMLYFCNSTTDGYSARGESTLNLKVGVKEPMHFIQQPENKTVMKGDMLTLHCNVTSYPSAEYVWFKDEHFVPQNLSSGTLYIQNVNSTHEGRYYCSAYNRFNKTNSTAVFVHVKEKVDLTLVILLVGGSIIGLIVIIMVFLCVTQRFRYTISRNAAGPYSQIDESERNERSNADVEVIEGSYDEPFREENTDEKSNASTGHPPGADSGHCDPANAPSHIHNVSSQTSIVQPGHNSTVNIYADKVVLQEGAINTVNVHNAMEETPPREIYVRATKSEDVQVSLIDDIHGSIAKENDSNNSLPKQIIGNQAAEHGDNISSLSENQLMENQKYSSNNREQDILHPLPGNSDRAPVEVLQSDENQSPRLEMEKQKEFLSSDLNQDGLLQDISEDTLVKCSKRTPVEDTYTDETSDGQVHVHTPDYERSICNTCGGVENSCGCSTCESPNVCASHETMSEADNNSQNLHMLKLGVYDIDSTPNDDTKHDIDSTPNDDTKDDNADCKGS